MTQILVPQALTVVSTGVRITLWGLLKLDVVGSNPIARFHYPCKNRKLRTKPLTTRAAFSSVPVRRRSPGSWQSMLRSVRHVSGVRATRLRGWTFAHVELSCSPGRSNTRCRIEPLHPQRELVLLAVNRRACMSLPEPPTRRVETVPNTDNPGYAPCRTEGSRLFGLWGRRRPGARPASLPRFPANCTNETSPLKLLRRSQPSGFGAARHAGSRGFRVFARESSDGARTNDVRL